MSKSTPGEPPHKGLKAGTRTVIGGRDPLAFHGFVNPPVVHASTVLYRNVGDYLARRGRYTYGRRGTPTSEALAAALAEVEGPQCAGVALLSSGLAAISLALLSVTQAGDHVLVTDNAYEPTRKFCDDVLRRHGVTTTYFDPMIGGGIAALVQPKTRAVFVESPGSLSFEVQDVPAIAAAAHAGGAVVLMDNTWASPLYVPALEKGVDLAIQSGSKYIGGHADLMFGTVAANAACWPGLRETVFSMGLCVGPDDMFLAMRGLRTMAVRLAHHNQAGLKVARWFAQRPEVARVLHPALESCPGHAIWKRDFSGSSGLFSIILRPAAEQAVHAFVDALTLFGIGASWGGFESLIIPFDCSKVRTATSWAPSGPALRFHIGLEDVDDLIADLERAFAAMAGVPG
jgi:cystathionine beta-lyase